MEVTALPFNRFLGMEPAAHGSGFLVSLPGLPQYTNHLGTVHASALLAVAEAGSGELLLRHFHFMDASGYVPVVRRLEAKFRKPASGRISARGSLAADEFQRLKGDLELKGRAHVRVDVEVVDENGGVALAAVVEWFIVRARKVPA
jgi:acyl-coenzyme A thioesterase PaaI-like protein